MFPLRVAVDIDECREIWNFFIKPERFSDLWEVRECFHRHFKRRPFFIVDNNCEDTFIPLSRIEEDNYYGYFPGETWHGNTWLEQNRVFIPDRHALDDLLSMLDLPCRLRYIPDIDPRFSENISIDEIGYLFSPPEYDYDILNYFKVFSRKSYKQISRCIDAIFSKGVSFRYDDISDFDTMISMNIKRFGKKSYFFDPRFMQSFKSLAFFLMERGWLKIVTVMINGRPAAVDMACLYNRTLAVLAGGTDPDFPGIAKLINMHHIEKACEERLDEIDFLCGDFTWKKLFHLMPRPLYHYSSNLNYSEDKVSPSLHPGSLAGAVYA